MQPTFKISKLIKEVCLHKKCKHIPKLKKNNFEACKSCEQFKKRSEDVCKTPHSN